MLRIGRAANVECVPVWSTSFPLEAGILFKTLLLQKQDGSPSLLVNFLYHKFFLNSFPICILLLELTILALKFVWDKGCIKILRL